MSWVVARWSGPRVIGTVSWVMSFATALLIFAKFGLDLGASRLASEFGVTEPGRLRRLFRSALRLRVLFTFAVAIPAFVFAAPIAAFFNDPDLLNPIRIGALIVVCASLFEFNESFLIGLNRLNTVYKVRSTHLLLRVTLVCALVALGYGATEILGGYAAAWTAAIIVCGVLLYRFLPVADGTDPGAGFDKRLFVLSATLAISSASVTVYSHMDRLMLGYFTGVEEVGQFAIARNTTEVSLFPVFAMVMMLRPALASRFASSRLEECSQIIRQSLRFSLISGMLFVAIFAVLGVQLVTLVFSDSYRYSGELMVFFIGVIALRSIGSVILPALIAADRTRLYAYLTTISALINFALNVVLIPRFGARGAIVATIISYSILLVVGLREVFRTYSVRLSVRAISLAARTILAAFMAAGAVWLISYRVNVGEAAILWAALISVLYILMIFLFRVGDVGDVHGLMANLRKQRG